MASATPDLQLPSQLKLVLICQRDGQAELTWVAGYITRPKTVTHLGTNRTQRRVTTLIETQCVTTKLNRRPVVYKVLHNRLLSSVANSNLQ